MAHQPRAAWADSATLAETTNKQVTIREFARSASVRRVRRLRQELWLGRFEDVKV
jgi:hypothetical protein